MAVSFDGSLIVVVAAWIVYLSSLAASRILSRTKILPDHPNHRSSHALVTSKAGGLAIMGGWLAGAFIIGVFSGAPETGIACLKLALLGLGALAIGAVDDRWDISPLFKFTGQSVLAILFIISFSSLRAGPVPFLGMINFGFAGALISMIWIIGFMNAFNFMDGSNGLASGAAAVGLAGFAVIASLSGEPFTAIMAFLLATAIFGFLPSNLKRGKLFMGDNGSQAVSFLIAAFAILSANWSEGKISFLVLPVIFWPLIFDVAVTLIHRLMRNQNILSAHREHLYQIMLRLGASHPRVAVIYMTLTALSTAGAIFMLALPAANQWLVPAALTMLFGIGASNLYVRAFKAGLFNPPDAQKPAGEEAAQAGG